MIYVFFAPGFEDLEALAPVDILRRAGLAVKTVSITGEKIVESAHGVGMCTDILLDEVEWESAELLVLPGGLPGATNLDACAPLREGLKKQNEAGRPVAAICAAPLVLGHLGILQGRRATCYPGFEGELTGATYTASLVERDGNVVTGKGPGAALAFGYELLKLLGKETEAAQLSEGMMYNFLLNA